MLTCATCGHEEPEGSRFCGNCSAPLVSADTQPARAVASSGMLTCATCGHEEPEGSRFCGNCSAPFVPAEPEPAEQELARTASVEAAHSPETPSPQLAAQEPSPVDEPRSAPPPKGMRRLLWGSVGAAGLLLVAGGATAAVLSFTGGDSSTEAMPTEQQPLFGATSESEPSASSPTLADTMAPQLDELAASQAALNTQVSSLSAGVESFAALHAAAESLAASVARTQQLADSLVPADSNEASTLSLLRRALAEHLAYAEAISSLPPRTRDFTSAQARATMARAEQARRAYVSLVGADPALPVVYISGSDHNALLAVVPSPKPPPPIAARRTIDLVPLLVGLGPDDPLGEGRCFGPYGGGSLRVSGVVYRSGFIQCGDGADGDPSRASGVYRFSGLRSPAGSRLIRITGQAVIDEWSSPSQRGSSVTWTVFYDGTPICSETVVWSGSRPLPRDLECRIPSAVASGGFDLARLQVQQVASLASTGDFWAGLLNPTIVAEVPR